MRQLTLLRSGVKEAEFRLDLPDVIIGRGRSAHVRLDGNPMVSRQHAVVRERGNGHVVEDLGGANGTWVNGHAVDVHVLRPGDHIVLGEDTLRYDFAVATATSLRASVTGSQSPVDGTMGTSDGLEAIEELDEAALGSVEELGEVREARREQAPAPMTAGPLPGGAERTAVASRDELERLLAEMVLRRGPHLVVVGSDPEIVHPLPEGGFAVGHTDACVVRLKGSRWLRPGKVAGRFVKQAAGWCLVPESPFWNPVLFKGQKLPRLRPLSHGDELAFRGLSLRYSRGEDR